MTTETQLVTRTLRLKVKREAYPWLVAAAREVNLVWNWANETSVRAIRRYSGAPKFLSGYDLTYLAAGASACMERIGSDTINQVCLEYAQKRKGARRVGLNWRSSAGSRKSLGWIPFRSASVKRKGAAIRFCGKTFRIFESGRLHNACWGGGCFAQDAVGDWWLCLPTKLAMDSDIAPQEAVGIDLGLKAIATTSDGDQLQAGRWTHGAADKLAMAQRRGHKRQAKRIHRKAARQRQDALHKFSTNIVRTYQNIVVGDVSSIKLVKTRMAKSVLDSGWGMLKTQLQYKGQQAGRCVEIVNERNTTRDCSSCGQHTGPSGLRQLVVRAWQCSACGAEHDRDVNAARNIAMLGSKYRPPSAGTRRKTP